MNEFGIRNLYPGKIHFDPDKLGQAGLPFFADLQQAQTCPAYRASSLMPGLVQAWLFTTSHLLITSTECLVDH